MNNDKFHKLIQDQLFRDTRRLILSLSKKIDLIEDMINKQNNKES